jgi:DNA-directed RNA polymerase specialized sigma24 family protein
MRIVEELPYDVIAERVCASPKAVRMRVSRGLRALRRGLEQEPIEDLV